jgi:UDP-glucose 4-epimerase
MASLKGKRILVTGGAGFVGSHIVDRLVKDGNDVVVYDNLSTGYRRFLDESADEITFVKGDLLDESKLGKALKEIDFVFHMAANADVKDNLKEPTKCLQQNTVTTSNVLEAMRKNDVNGIAFASTGSVYGEPKIFPTPEDAPFPTQTSMYGASKLACEGLLEAYSEGYGFNAFIFRFVSLMGERYTHGHVLDFYKRLSTKPNELLVLGDGHQRKSYLYVLDCVEAMHVAIRKSQNKINVYNLGTDEYCEVNESIAWITGRMGLKPRLKYTGGRRGWPGDSPFIFLDTAKIRKLGWKAKLSIKDSVIRTVDYLTGNPWVLEMKP